MTVVRVNPLRALLDAPKIAAECPPGLDSHTWTASKIFGVPYDDVTPDQRSAVKLACFGASPTGRLRERVGPPLHNFPIEASAARATLRAAFSSMFDRLDSEDGAVEFDYAAVEFDYAAAEKSIAERLRMTTDVDDGEASS